MICNLRILSLDRPIPSLFITSSSINRFSKQHLPCSGVKCRSCVVPLSPWRLTCSAFCQLVTSASKSRLAFGSRVFVGNWAIAQSVRPSVNIMRLYTYTQLVSVELHTHTHKSVCMCTNTGLFDNFDFFLMPN